MSEDINLKAHASFILTGHKRKHRGGDAGDASPQKSQRGDANVIRPPPPADFGHLRHVLCNEYDHSAGNAQSATMFQASIASHTDFPPVSRWTRCGMPRISLTPLAVSI